MYDQQTSSTSEEILLPTTPHSDFYKRFVTGFTAKFTGKHADVLRCMLPENRKGLEPNFELGLTAAEKKHVKGTKASAIAAFIRVCAPEIIVVAEASGYNGESWNSLQNEANLIGVCNAIDAAYYHLIPRAIRVLDIRAKLNAATEGEDSVLLILSKIELLYKELADLDEVESDSMKVTKSYQLLSNRPEVILPARESLRIAGIVAPTFAEAKAAIIVAHQSIQYVQFLQNSEETHSANLARSLKRSEPSRGDGRGPQDNRGTRIVCPHCKPYIRNEKGSTSHSPNDCFYNKDSPLYKPELMERAKSRKKSKSGRPNYANHTTVDMQAVEKAVTNVLERLGNNQSI